MLARKSVPPKNLQKSPCPPAGFRRRRRRIVYLCAGSQQSLRPPVRVRRKSRRPSDRIPVQPARPPRAVKATQQQSVRRSCAPALNSRVRGRKSAPPLIALVAPYNGIIRNFSRMDRFSRRRWARRSTRPLAWIPYNCSIIGNERGADFRREMGGAAVFFFNRRPPHFTVPRRAGVGGA